MIEYVIIAVYIFSAAFVFLFCATQAALLFFYLKIKRRAKAFPALSQREWKTYPFITVQLPVYNELYVIGRLIDAVCLFDYPKDRFEIQVLDDSTDETTALIRGKVNQYRAMGYSIHHIQRENKNGYKAGALQHGMQLCQGEFIAIFDADFIPDKNFLRNTLPLFEEPNVGMVQAKWKHLNRNYSVLTRLQAFMLDAHFNIEQNGRYASGAFMNFNGTAGVWRKSCIEDAGGWSSDTLTEDLDLSYRAQMRGWKLIYNESVGVPAELPSEMGAFRSQQFRWSKGPAQVCKKMLLAVLLSNISWRVKWLAFFHLFNSSIQIFVFLIAFLSVPLLLFRENSEHGWAISIIYAFYSGTSVISLVFIFSQIFEERSVRKGISSFALLYPAFISVMMGMSLQNALAALRGLFGRKSPFVRTPKFNIILKSDSWRNKRYHLAGISGITIIEMLMAFYFLYGICISLYSNRYELLVFHVLSFTGFLTISLYSIKHGMIGSK